MRQPLKRPLFAYFTLLALVLVALSGTAFRSTPHVPATAAGAASAADLSNLDGTWTGTWQDTIYGVGGDMTFDFNVAGSVFEGTIDLSMLGLGVQSGSASVIAATDSFEFTGSLVGWGRGELPGDGSASGFGSVTPPLGYGDFTFNGTVGDGVLWGTFDFLSPTGGAGKAILWNTTPTEETNMSAVKSAYGDH